MFGAQHLFASLHDPRGLTFGAVEDAAANISTCGQTKSAKRVKLFFGFYVWNDGTYTAPSVDSLFHWKMRFDMV